LNVLKDSQMVWLLCTEIATIDFLAYFNTSPESMVWEEKLPLLSFSSLHDLIVYSNLKKKSFKKVG
jgi:hypothetical protein